MFEFKVDGRRVRLQMDIDPDALMDNAFESHVRVTLIDDDNPEREQRVDAVVRVSVVPDGLDLDVELRGERLPLGSARFKVEYRQITERLVVTANNRVVFSVEGFEHNPTLIERVVNAVPGFVYGLDPVVGCAIKAGVSSIIGQAIECFRQRAGERVLHNMLSCMRVKVPRLGSLTVMKTLRCIAKFATGFEIG